MGVSTNAIVYYGIEFGDEFPISEETFEEYEHVDASDWEELLAVKQGVEHPGEWKDDEETKKKFNDFWEKQRNIVKKFGVTIGTHCSDEYPMYYIAVEESHIIANRGFPKELDVYKFSILTSMWDIKIREFCELMGIEYSQPKWMLCSYWG